MKNFLKDLHEVRHKGYSLIEVIISFGIISVVSVFSMKMVEINTKNNKLNRGSFEEAEFMNQMSSILLDANSCRINLVGKNADSTDFPNLVDQDGNVAVTLNDLIGQSESVQLTNIESSKITGQSALRVNFLFERQGNVIGPGTYSRFITVFVELDGSNNVVDCLDVGEGMTESAGQLTCLNNVDRGAFIPLLNNDGELIGCERIPYDLGACNDTSEYFWEIKTSYDAYGVANNKTKNCISASSSSSTSCPSGTYLYFDSLGPKCGAYSSTVLAPAFNIGSSVNCSGKTDLNLNTTASASLVTIECN